MAAGVWRMVPLLQLMGRHQHLGRLPDLLHTDHPVRHILILHRLDRLLASLPPDVVRRRDGPPLRRRLFPRPPRVRHRRDAVRPDDGQYLVPVLAPHPRAGDLRRSRGRLPLRPLGGRAPPVLPAEACAGQRHRRLREQHRRRHLPDHVQPAAATSGVPLGDARHRLRLLRHLPHQLLPHAYALPAHAEAQARAAGRLQGARLLPLLSRHVPGLPRLLQLPLLHPVLRHRNGHRRRPPRLLPPRDAERRLHLRPGIPQLPRRPHRAPQRPHPRRHRHRHPLLRLAGRPQRPGDHRPLRPLRSHLGRVRLSPPRRNGHPDQGSGRPGNAPGHGLCRHLRRPADRDAHRRGHPQRHAPVYGRPAVHGVLSHRLGGRLCHVAVYPHGGTSSHADVVGAWVVILNDGLYSKNSTADNTPVQLSIRDNHKQAMRSVLRIAFSLSIFCSVRRARAHRPRGD